MTCEEILRRVEEIEAELGDGSTDDYPAPETITVACDEMPVIE